MGINYYSVLNVKRHCANDDIHKAFGRLTSRLSITEHVNDGDLIHLCEAYEVLSDPFRRILYDHYGEDGIKKGLITDDLRKIEPWVYHGDVIATYSEYCAYKNPITRMFFKSGGRIPMMGVDNNKGCPDVKQLCLKLTLNEIFYGAIKSIQTSDSPCVKGSNSIIVNVPRGFPTGGVIRNLVPKAGLQDSKILYVFTTEDVPHNVFKRDNMNLIMVINVSLKQALNGIRVNVRTLDHKFLRVNITQVITQNYVKTIHGYGMPDMNDPTRYGDIIVKFVVNYPLYLTIETMKRYANCLTTINNKYPKLE